MAANFWASSHFHQWLFDRADLDRMRSNDLQALGCEESYSKLMLVYTNILQAVGEHLKVRQQVIATAAMYFKRFYLMCGFGSADPLLVLPTCLYLSAKAEEYGMISGTRLISAMQQIMKNKYGYALKFSSHADFAYTYTMKQVCVPSTRIGFVKSGEGIQSMSYRNNQLSCMSCLISQKFP